MDSAAYRIRNSQRAVVVVGAGVDVSFNLPIVPNLFRDLAEFARSDGKPVNDALRKKVPRLQFSFERAAAQGGDELVSRLFEDPEDTVPTLDAIREKLGTDAETGAVGDVLESLSLMAKGNRVPPQLQARLTKTVAGTDSSGASETFLDARKLALTPLVRTAIRTSLEEALMRVGDFTPKEREFLEELVADTTNIETLQSLYFGRFTAVGRFAERRTYLYIAWMLWAFLQVRSASSKRSTPCFYDLLKQSRIDVITFNYTDFLGMPIGNQIIHFHGRLDQYIRLDDRTLITGDPQLGAVVDSRTAATFINGLRLDIVRHPAIDLPAIVPPLTFKPIMSREQLRAWSAADDLLAQAHVVVVVGYSFAQVDAHFNDILRKANPSARVVVVNPDLQGTAELACAALSLDKTTLQETTTLDGRPALETGRLSCLKAFADELSEREFAGLVA
jgi:hypothetical protein